MLMIMILMHLSTVTDDLLWTLCVLIRFVNADIAQKTLPIIADSSKYMQLTFKLHPVLMFNL